MLLYYKKEQQKHYSFVKINPVYSSKKRSNH
ncbi:hypothetical protein BCE_1408 [Bacillus cereus ATCC 10987]|uniref:Uncharacterized protein n=1 Tax=Bacillus cereus (strain ATCC 10987 / NRS 248) TaxID=222523 RepID=Q73BL0_BACC1|nr:hypothetical protein BCE_1408 [Bacillus cereus ATCC 10987]